MLYHLHIVSATFFFVSADSFTPISHGVAEEYGRVLKEGYSSIRDGVPQAEPHAKKVVVVGWCGDIQDLVDSLNMFAPTKTIVTVLCDCCPEVSFGFFTCRPYFQASGYDTVLLDLHC